MAAHDGNAEIDYRILWQRDQPRIRKLVAALEQAIVVFSGDRIFCTGCRAEDSGTIDTMKIIHKTLCPLAGVTTRHPSHEGAQCCELDTDHDGDCPVHPAGGKPFVVPQQPGLEFVEINGLSPLHILEQAVKLKSAQRLIEWGQRGWEIAGLLAGQDAREQPVWVAWTNTDLTEGRGERYPLCVANTPETAARVGRRNGVMGSDCEVTEERAYRIGRRWYVPGRIMAATAEDLQKVKIREAREEAESRARKAGLSDEDIAALRGDR